MGFRPTVIIKKRRAGVSPASLFRPGWKAWATNLQQWKKVTRQVLFFTAHCSLLTAHLNLSG
jgi:hypothetical protein